MNKNGTTLKRPAAVKERPPLPKAGDLMAVVAHYQSPLLRYVSRMAGVDETDAEDIVQETFVRLHRQVSTHGHTSIRNLTTWLYKTAQNLTIDSFRRGARHKKAMETISQTTASANEEAIQELDAMSEVLRQEARQAAISELSKLDEQYRQVVLLKIIQGMTLRQVADVVGVSTSLVNHRLNKGLAELAQRLKSIGVV